MPPRAGHTRQAGVGEARIKLHCLLSDENGIPIILSLNINLNQNNRISDLTVGLLLLRNLWSTSMTVRKHRLKILFAIVVGLLVAV